MPQLNSGMPRALSSTPNSRAAPTNCMATCSSFSAMTSWTPTIFSTIAQTRQSDSGAALASMPLAQYRTGDLSRATQIIRDPLNNNSPFTGNMIPQSRIVNPVARALFADQKLYPLPNHTGTGALGVTNNYVGVSATTLQNDQADAKVDVRLTDKDNLSARWSISRY